MMADFKKNQEKYISYKWEEASLSSAKPISLAYNKICTTCRESQGNGAEGTWGRKLRE